MVCVCVRAHERDCVNLPLRVCLILDLKTDNLLCGHNMDHVPYSSATMSRFNHRPSIHPNKPEVDALL